MVVGMDGNGDQILMVPGLYNSGPGIGRRCGRGNSGFARVEQRDWEMPRREDWVPVLDDAVAAQSVPVILVAHSLGCITVLFWAASALENFRKVKGALLVAPSDTERPEFPPGTTGFKPIPLEPLPFHSITVASTNDRYISLTRSEELARAWSSSFECRYVRPHIWCGWFWALAGGAGFAGSSA
jgi:predicted alpha/beta hydrolase family esterase